MDQGLDPGRAAKCVPASPAKRGRLSPTPSCGAWHAAGLQMLLPAAAGLGQMGLCCAHHSPDTPPACSSTSQGAPGRADVWLRSLGTEHHFCSSGAQDWRLRQTCVCGAQVSDTER